MHWLERHRGVLCQIQHCFTTAGLGLVQSLFGVEGGEEREQWQLYQWSWDWNG